MYREKGENLHGANFAAVVYTTTSMSKVVKLPSCMEVFNFFARDVCEVFRLIVIACYSHACLKKHFDVDMTANVSFCIQTWRKKQCDLVGLQTELGLCMYIAE